MVSYEEAGHEAMTICSWKYALGNFRATEDTALHTQRSVQDVSSGGPCDLSLNVWGD